MKVMSININRKYNQNISIYDAVKADWVVGEQRNDVKLVFAEYQGRVVKIFTCDGWKQNPNGRWEFWGKDVTKKYNKYMFMQIPKKTGQANPIYYFDI